MKDILKENLKIAMKAQERLRVETIRSLLSEIQYEEMQKGVNELTPTDALGVVQRELKKRHESMQFAEQANRPEAKEKLLGEIAVIEGFLPTQLGADKIEAIIGEYKSTHPDANLSVVMKYLKETYSGQYDGKVASEVARRLLS